MPDRKPETNNSVSSEPMMKLLKVTKRLEALCEILDRQSTGLLFSANTNPFKLDNAADVRTARHQFEFILQRRGPSAFSTFGTHIWCILRDAKKEKDPNSFWPTEAEFREAFYGQKKRDRTAKGSNVRRFPKGGAA